MPHEIFACDPELADASIHLSEHADDAQGLRLVYLWVDPAASTATEFGVSGGEMTWAPDVQFADRGGNRIHVSD